METMVVDVVPTACADWRALIVGINSILIAFAGLVSAYTAVKLGELRTRVKDVQQKVGANNRQHD